MKVLKRIVTGLLTIGMMLSLAACGSEGKEQTVTLRYEDTSSTTTMTSTITLNAIGDKLQSQKDVIEVDLSSLDDETKESITSYLYESYSGIYENIDSVTLEEEKTDTTYTLTLNVDFTDNLDALTKAGIVENGLVEGETDYISFTKTMQNMEAQGYKAVKDE